MHFCLMSLLTKLTNLKGEWKGTAKTYFRKDELADTSPIICLNRIIISDKVFIHEYKGSLLNSKMEGIMMINFNKTRNKNECSWIDNQHTGSELLILEANDNFPLFDVVGSYPTSNAEEIWRWGIKINVISDKEFSINHFNIPPNIDHYLGIEMIFTRKD